MAILDADVRANGVSEVITCAQRNNVEVVVLEARERIGGRVHSYRGDFSCDVDLGASIITGTQVPLRRCTDWRTPLCTPSHLRVYPPSMSSAMTERVSA